MPAKTPPITSHIRDQLHELGQWIRQRRKRLKVSATVAAEAAAMSRVTWHRIEKGEPSVTMGAYLSAMAVLGLDFTIQTPREEGRNTELPSRIRLIDYPQLMQLAWHVQGDAELTPREALDIYERNFRHLDLAAMSQEERELLEALRTGLGGKLE